MTRLLTILLALAAVFSLKAADLATTLGLTGTTAVTGITAEADDDTLTKTAHGLVTGRLVDLTAITGGSGLTAGTDYYVIRVSADTFKLATSRANAVGGTAVAISSDGTSITVTPLIPETLCWGGDSITDAQMCGIYEAAWWQLTYPDRDNPTYVIARSGSALGGWATAPPVPSGQSSQGLWERYHAPICPEIVLMMHGQNGGQTAAEHIASYQDLWNNWVGATGAKLVMLGMHPVQTTTDTKSAEGKADEEATWAATLPSRLFASHTFDQMGATWLSNGNNTIDVQQIGAEPFTTSGTANNDSAARIHPGPAGHIVIAWAHLKGLGVDTLVSSATIAANTSTVTASDHCTISNVSMTASGGTFKRLDARLPWAIDEAGRANAVALYPSIANWQTYSMTVTGLNAGTYYVKCDGVTIATKTGTQLAAGFNMADLTAGPVWEQCQEVLGEFRDLSGYDRTTGNAISPAPTGSIARYHSSNLSYYQNGDQRGSTYVGNMQTVTTALATPMAEIFADAQPVDRTYTIVSVSGNVPVINITVPSSAPTVASGASITFTAVATDTEDGTISANVVWTDSVDGALGTGSTVTPTLTVGFHTVTATITDGAGNVSFAEINANVTAPLSGSTATSASATTVNAGTAP